MIVKCPKCGKKVEWTKANQYRPFCSQRCQVVDRGAWANDDYTIPAPPPSSEFDD